MTGAGAALQAAMIERLGQVEGLSGVYPGAPLQATVPFATVEHGGESDWSHKSGRGREVRIAVGLRDDGERPARMQTLMAAAEAAFETPPEADGWTLAGFVWLRSRLAREGRGSGAAWSGLIEYRARMLAPDES